MLMTELSLHILDIAQNSVNADASVIEISVSENILQDILSLEIIDNGNGMTMEELRKAKDPFYSTGHKKTGLGIPLLKQQSEQSNGKFSLVSESGKGTRVAASFQYSHIDRQPVGDMNATIISLIRAWPEIDWKYTHSINGKSFILDTCEIREELDDIPINNSKVVGFLRDMLQENIQALSDLNKTD